MSLLFPCNKVRFSHVEAQINPDKLTLRVKEKLLLSYPSVFDAQEINLIQNILFINSTFTCTLFNFAVGLDYM